jgi:exosortase K
VNRIATVLIALIATYAFKHYYSTAGADELQWILLPTTVLVELWSGKVFAFESHSGYMEAGNHFLIGASCSGANFLLAAFLLLTLVWIEKPVWWNLFAAVLTAYLCTILANAVRISLSMALFESGFHYGWLNGARVHRIEGILIYFGFLLVLFEVASSGLMRTGRPRCKLWIPLLIYYAVALGIPFVNGAFHQGLRFCEHALFTISLPMLIVLAVRLCRSREVLKRLQFCPLLQRPSNGRRSIVDLQFEHHQRSSG